MSERATPPIRVLLAGDHPSMRRRIAGVLDDAPDNRARGRGRRARGIAEKTDQGYLSNVLQTLQASDRAHAVVIAPRRGMPD